MTPHLAPLTRIAGLLVLLFCRCASADESAHEGDLATRDALSGNWGGERSTLEDEGILLGADSIDEVLSNVSGGAGLGTVYEGRLEVLATLNLEKLAGWTGATFHVNAYETSGRGLSTNYLGNNRLVASNIEADRSARLFDLWVEQVLADGMISIRGGRIAADDEFFTSQYAAAFVNATFGWPGLLSADLPSGGAAYPLATPGIRISVAPTDALTLSAAALNGDPTGAGLTGDPLARDKNGLAFRGLNDAFIIGELAYAVNQDKDAPGLPATYKIGAWYHTGDFPDQRFDNTGQSLAAPTSSGVPALHRSDYGAYALFDQAIWRDADIADRSVGLFFRVGGSPSDRNEISLYADGGIEMRGLFIDHPDDLVGISAAVAKVSDRARGFDADLRRFGGFDTPIRDSESAVEFMYRYQATPWWTLQPDLQFIRHPGGNLPLPNDPLRAVPNAVVIGMRSAILF